VKNIADNTYETDLRKYKSACPEFVEGLNERMKAFLIYRRRYGSTGSDVCLSCLYCTVD
jgi:hypothetical protein